MSTLFDLGFESDLSEFDSTVTHGGDLYWAAAAALAGTAGGVACLIDDQTAIYGVVTQAAPVSGELRYRFYVDPNSLTIANGDNFYLLMLRATAPQVYLHWHCLLRNVGGVLKLGSKAYDDGDSLSMQTCTITDAPHHVEVHIERASSDVAADGRVRWWVDGVLVSTDADVDNYDTFGSITDFRLGAVSGIDVTTFGTFYLDEFRANDDGKRIGPVGLSARIDHHYRTRRV